MKYCFASIAALVCSAACSSVPSDVSPDGGAQVGDAAAPAERGRDVIVDVVRLDGGLFTIEGAPGFLAHLGRFSSGSVALVPRRIEGGELVHDLTREVRPVPQPERDLPSGALDVAQSDPDEPLWTALTSWALQRGGIAHVSRGGTRLGRVEIVTAPYVPEHDRGDFWLGDFVGDGERVDFRFQDPAVLILEGGAPVVYVSGHTVRDDQKPRTAREGGTHKVVLGSVLRVPIDDEGLGGRELRDAESIEGEMVASGCRPEVAVLDDGRMLMLTRAGAGWRPAPLLGWRSEPGGAWAEIAPPRADRGCAKEYEVLAVGDGFVAAVFVMDEIRTTEGRRYGLALELWFHDPADASWRRIELPPGAPQIEGWDGRQVLPPLSLLRGDREGEVLVAWITEEQAIRCLEVPLD